MLFLDLQSTTYSLPRGAVHIYGNMSVSGGELVFERCSLKHLVKKAKKKNIYQEEKKHGRNQGGWYSTLCFESTQTRDTKAIAGCKQWMLARRCQHSKKYRDTVPWQSTVHACSGDYGNRLFSMYRPPHRGLSKFTVPDASLSEGQVRPSIGFLNTHWRFRQLLSCFLVSMFSTFWVCSTQYAITLRFPVGAVNPTATSCGLGAAGKLSSRHRFFGFRHALFFGCFYGVRWRVS